MTSTTSLGPDTELAYLEEEERNGRKTIKIKETVWEDVKSIAGYIPPWMRVKAGMELAYEENDVDDDEGNEGNEEESSSSSSDHDSGSEETDSTVSSNTRLELAEQGEGEADGGESDSDSDSESSTISSSSSSDGEDNQNSALSITERTYSRVINLVTPIFTTSYNYLLAPSVSWVLTSTPMKLFVAVTNVAHDGIMGYSDATDVRGVEGERGRLNSITQIASGDGIESSVDLPLPEGPFKATKPPFSISKSTPLRAVTLF